MRVVVSSLTYPLPNGVTSSINESVDGFLSEGHEVLIVSPDYGNGQARPEHHPVKSSRVGRVVANMFGKKERMFSVQALGDIRDIVEEFNPDAFWLHTVSWAPNAFEKVMLESSRAKVLTYHTMVAHYGNLYVGAVGEQQMIRRSRDLCNEVDRIITPSQYMESLLHQYEVTKPIDVIATGIVEPKKKMTKAELRGRYNIPADHQILIYVGRVVKEKNIEALLEALSLVTKKHPKTTLVLVGPGDIEETLEQARELGVDKNLVCTDQLPLEEAKSTYSAADIFVFSSQSETQGLVVGEAMISSVPVVALHSPIQPEVYPESVALVATSIEGFAQQIVKALEDSSLRDRLGRLGKEFVESNFTKEIMLRKQLRTFELAIDSVSAKSADS